MFNRSVETSYVKATIDYKAILNGLTHSSYKGADLFL